ncbi:MAG: TadE/TadG family type IV pilus assembly protein [Pseudomonadota bacterium]
MREPIVEPRNQKSNAGIIGGIKRFKKDENGATAVEFAFVSLPFFALVLAIIETCLAFFAGQALETAVDEAARKIRTGQVGSVSHDLNKFTQEVCSCGLQLFNCANLKLDVKSYATFSASSPSVPLDNGNLDASGLEFNPGGAGSINVVRAYYEWPVVLDYLWAGTNNMSNGKRLLVATAAFRSEPFSGAGGQQNANACN